MCIFHARRAAICAAAAHDEFIKYLALLMISELQAADQVSQVNQVNRAESSGIEWTQREGGGGLHPLLQHAAGTMQQFGGNL